MDLWSREAVKQDHAASHEGTQDQAFAHGPPLPSLLARHGPTESVITLKTQNFAFFMKVFFIVIIPPASCQSLHCSLLGAHTAYTLNDLFTWLVGNKLKRKVTP